MSWEAVADRAAKTRAAAIIAKITAAVAEHAPHSDVELQGNELRVRGLRLKQRWLSEAALRFARRIAR